MKLGISLHIDGTVEERLPQLTTSDSPLKLEKQIDSYYTVYSKDPVLDQLFVYSTPDSEIMSGSSLHKVAQKALNFQSGSEFLYRKFYVNPEKLAVFRNIMEHIVANNIPSYMTATDEFGNETMIRGYNPIINTEIQNPNFNQTLSELLK